MASEKDTTIQIKRLANDSEYYSGVFKKTEKLVSVVLYILSHINASQDKKFYLDIIKDKALRTHEESLKTLRLPTYETNEGLLDFQYALADLESTLRVAEAAQFLPTSVTPLLFEQLIAVERTLSMAYITEVRLDIESPFPALEQKQSKTTPKKVSDVAKAPAQPRRRQVVIPEGDISSDAYFVYSQLTDRAERIKTVLEAKPQATIRDIADIITDVSEKTIQRELNSLIEKGQVVREGERRWSRYSVVK
jgi:DNA-binding transcriptional ArsR family regulator